MIYSKRHPLSAAKFPTIKVSHRKIEGPSLFEIFCVPVPSPVKWETDYVESPDCTIRFIDVPKLVNTLKRSLKEFDDQVASKS